MATTDAWKDRVNALAAFLDCDPDDISPETYDDCLFSAEGGEYLVLDDDEAYERCEEYIRESVWAFRPEWLADYMPGGLSPDDVDSIRGDRCEDANDLLTALIEAGEGMDLFVSNSIVADGRGHFLSSYDGEEHEQGPFFIYRVN
ncbi:MAG: hypothetical protein AAFX41_10480 [Bacteroidota bacterium]